MKRCVRDKLNIFGKIQLINKKSDSNIDGHMKEQSRKNEACSFKEPP